jgi:hypothetical protein
MLYMSEKPKRKRCPNGTRKDKKKGECVKKSDIVKRPRCPNGSRKDKTTGECKKKAEPVKQARQGGPERSKNGKKKVIKIIKNKPKKEEPVREKKKTIRITDKKKKLDPIEKKTSDNKAIYKKKALEIINDPLMIKYLKTEMRGIRERGELVEYPFFYGLSVNKFKDGQQKEFIKYVDFFGPQGNKIVKELEIKFGDLALFNFGLENLLKRLAFRPEMVAEGIADRVEEEMQNYLDIASNNAFNILKKEGKNDKYFKELPKIQNEIKNKINSAYKEYDDSNELADKIISKYSKKYNVKEPVRKRGVIRVNKNLEKKYNDSVRLFNKRYKETLEQINKKAKPKPKEPENNNLKTLLVEITKTKNFQGDPGYSINYQDKNLLIAMDTVGDTLQNPDLIYLALFTAQDNEKKPRAPKGYASRALCQLLELLLQKKIINKRLPFDLDAVNLKGDEGDQKKLESFYQKLGFKYKEIGDTEMTQSVNSFLKKCRENGRLVEQIEIKKK